MTKSDNFAAFTKFRDSVENKKQLSNGDETFVAFVEYEWNSTKETEELNVTLQLTSEEYGRIKIDEGKKINSDFVHLDINPNYQSYQFIQNKMLRIIGKNSPKIGNYEIVLSEK